MKVWSSARDERCCDVCKNLHGTEVPLEEPFPFETRLSDPDAHSHCRCAIDIKEIEPPPEPNFDEIEEIEVDYMDSAEFAEVDPRFTHQIT